MIIYRPNGTALLDITPDDDSYVFNAIMGEHNLTLRFSLAEYVDIPVGSYATWLGTTYYLLRPAAVKIEHRRAFDFTVTLEPDEGRLALWLLRDILQDGGLQFSMIGRPSDFMTMVQLNLRSRGDNSWTATAGIDAPEQALTFSATNIREALNNIAQAFNTEWECTGKSIVLHKVEKSGTPLPLMYGKGNGFRSGVRRTNDSTMPIGKLYAIGGDRNIDYTAYGAHTLHLPKNATLSYDGTHFSGETGYDSSKARTYRTDANGLYVQNTDSAYNANDAETTLDCSEIYPAHVGTVTKVVFKFSEDGQEYDSVQDASTIASWTDAQWDTVITDFFDNTIPASLDYSQCRVPGEIMYVAFQSGELLGRSFDILSKEDELDGFVKSENRFKLVGQNLDGVWMPSRTFVPRVGDKYAVFGCSLPATYNQEAQDEMFKKCVKYLRENEDLKFTFTGEIDPIWARAQWENVGSKFVCGYYVAFSDIAVQSTPVNMRITSVRQYINSLYKLQIEVSNATVKGGVSLQLAKIDENKIISEQQYNESLSFTKRRYRDAIETMNSLAEALSGYDEAISPIAVRTMQLLVGDERLQFNFFRANGDIYGNPVTYDDATKILECGLDGVTLYVKHYTLGIDTLTSEFLDGNRLVWSIPYREFNLAASTTMRYIYVKAPEYASGSEVTWDAFRGGATPAGATFESRETPVDLSADSQGRLQPVAGYYWFLVGILNSELNDSRSFAPLYGFTEILPGRITTSRVVSQNGDSYFDLENNAFNLGQSNGNGLSYNVNNDGRLVLRGTLVQSSAGSSTSYIPCDRGVYSASATYGQGDVVQWTDNGVTSTYMYINATASSGNAPSDTTYWKVYAQGAAGAAGVKNAIVYLYKRASSTPSGKPTNDLTYTFATGILSASSSSHFNGWTQAIPADNGNPLYVIGATASSSGDTDTIAKNEWTDPTMLAKDGTNGTNGLNSATIVLYQRSSSTPSKPQYDSTYTFSTGTLSSSSLGNWQRTIPAQDNNKPCWSTQATAIANTSTDTIGSSEWSAPAQILENGAPGAPGLKNAIVYLYKRSSTASPAGPSGALTYTFEGATLSGSNFNGWTQAIPANDGNPLYVIAATASGTGDTDSIAKTEWSSAVVMAEDGTDGTNGLNSASVFLYKRSAKTSTPSVPSANLTYTFATGALTGTGSNPLAGWTRTPPAVDGNPCWVIQATAIANTATDTIASGEWSAPVILVEDGENGAAGPGIVYRGNWDDTTALPSGTTFYCEANRADVVKHTSGSTTSYYKCKTTHTRRTWSSNDWEEFGASFSSIATGLLFAEYAQVENLGTKYLHIYKNGSTTPIGGMHAYNNSQSFAPYLWLGGSTPSTAPFRVDGDGNLTATQATITGAVTATSGSFTGAVTATSGSFTGAVHASSGEFTGTITSGSGTIGGLTIDTKCLKYGSNLTIWSDDNGSSGSLNSIGIVTKNRQNLFSSTSASYVPLNVTQSVNTGLATSISGGRIEIDSALEFIPSMNTTNTDKAVFKRLSSDFTLPSNVQQGRMFVLYSSSSSNITISAPSGHTIYRGNHTSNQIVLKPGGNAARYFVIMFYEGSSTWHALQPDCIIGD